MKSKYYIILLLGCLMMAGCNDDARSRSDNDSIEDIYFNDYVSPSDKWGYMDKTGRTVIKPKYDDVRDMKTSLTAANLKGKWGYIDPRGKKLLISNTNKFMIII